ncbi:hypothetical protein IGI04_027214, partial [Brassica rapa subsp. trilocularis]
MGNEKNKKSRQGKLGGASSVAKRKGGVDDEADPGTVSCFIITTNIATSVNTTTRRINTATRVREMGTSHTCTTKLRCVGMGSMVFVISKLEGAEAED